MNAMRDPFFRDAFLQLCPRTARFLGLPCLRSDRRPALQAMTSWRCAKVGEVGIFC